MPDLIFNIPPTIGALPDTITPHLLPPIPLRFFAAALTCMSHANPDLAWAMVVGEGPGGGGGGTIVATDGHKLMRLAWDAFEDVTNEVVPRGRWFIPIDEVERLAKMQQSALDEYPLTWSTRAQHDPRGKFPAFESILTEWQPGEIGEIGFSARVLPVLGEITDALNWPTTCWRMRFGLSPLHPVMCNAQSHRAVALLVILMPMRMD